MSRAAMAIGLALAGCGGADFSGHWAGAVTVDEYCQFSGNSVRQSFNVEYVANQDGNTVSFAGDTGCGVLTAIATGTTAVFQMATCPSVTANHVTAQDHVVGGTAILKGNAVEVSAQLSTDLTTDKASGTCTGTEAGTLAKK